MEEAQQAGYTGELIVGQVHGKSRMQVTVDWETKSTRMADILSLIVSDGRDDGFIKLTLPENWNATRFPVGSVWTFGIRSYVNKAGKLVRALRTDLEPYQDK